MNDLNFSVNLLAPNAPYSLLRAQGAEAASFLQGQLTQDVLLLPANTLRLAAWCSAKGRMLASFWVWKNSNEELFLLTSRDVAAATLKRLKMFVLRAKCSLDDVTTQVSLIGQVASDATDLIANYAINSAASGQNTLLNARPGLVLPAVSVLGRRIGRRLHLESVAGAEVADAALLERWQSLEVASGIARITSPVVEAFVPQMLNYESVDGVSFKKGCYPGQEVVARSQFRGAIKRRGYLLSCAVGAFAGQEVFDASEPDTACGQIAQAALGLDGSHTLAMACLQTSANLHNLRLGSAQGEVLSPIELPYLLREDI